MNKPNKTNHEHPLDVDRALEHIYTTPSPDAAFVNRLEQQLLAQQESKAKQANGSSRHSFWVGWNIRWRWAAGLAGVAIVLIASLALATWLNRPQPVSAQEIMQKAQTSMQSPAASGLQSYVITETQRMTPLNPRVAAYGGGEGEQTVQIETRRWYAAPNRGRTELQMTTLAPDGKVVDSSSSVQVSDGTDLWLYSPTDSYVTIYTLDAGANGKDSLALFGNGLMNLNDLFQSTSTCYNAKVAGDATVAGRAAYVIDLGPSLCPSASAPEMNGKLMIWVDKETFFVLKQEQYSIQGDTVIMSSEVQQVQYNVAIDPARFTFTPPSGLQVQDYRPKPTPSASEYQAQLEQLAKQHDFPLFVPGYMLQGLGPLQPHLESMGGTQVILPYVPPAEAGQDALAGPNGVNIVEQRATEDVVPGWMQGTESITLTNSLGWLWRGVQNADGTGSDSTVLVVRDGTLISVSSFKVVPEELVKIADSLRTVAGGHAPLPNPTLPTRSPHYTPTPVPTPSFTILRPTWLPELATVREQFDGQMVTLGFDPHPNDPPHEVMTLMETPKSSITPGGSPDPQAGQEKIAGYDVTVIYRGQNCTMADWDSGDLHLTLTNTYDPPGQLRYTCEQMRKVIESIQ